MFISPALKTMPGIQEIPLTWQRSGGYSKLQWTRRERDVRKYYQYMLKGCWEGKQKNVTVTRKYRGLKKKMVFFNRLYDLSNLMAIYTDTISYTKVASYTVWELICIFDNEINLKIIQLINQSRQNMRKLSCMCHWLENEQPCLQGTENLVIVI